jgi:hypothetical protein
MTHKPPHTQARKSARKKARTAIYRAVYGQQDFKPWTDEYRGQKRPNEPWRDKSRRHPEGWSAQHAFETFRQHSAEAALPRKALIEIASALGVELKELQS